MRLLLLTLLLGAVSLNSTAQSKQQTDILNQFIKAHNIGSVNAITTFIKGTYEPEVYKKINLRDHLDFYFQIINEFGPLSHVIYKEIETEPTRYTVHLIKKGEDFRNQYIKPEDILVVKIDLTNKQSEYMPHGLGLGSLLCEQRKF